MIVKLRENEPFEVALRRFKRAIEKTGLLTELRARESYEKPTTERKRKHAAACKRNYKRLRAMQLPPKMYLIFLLSSENVRRLPREPFSFVQFDRSPL